MSDNKKTLPEITLVAISSVHLYETVRALLSSMRGIEYGDVLLLSHHKPRYLPKKIRFERIGELKNIDDYSHFCIYELGKHIWTDYALIVHHDGFVVNPSSGRIVFFNTITSVRPGRFPRMESAIGMHWEISCGWETAFP